MEKKKIMGLKIAAPKSYYKNGHRIYEPTAIGWSLIEQPISEDDCGSIEGISDKEIFNIARQKLGAYLKSLRESKGISKEVIAERMRISVEKLETIESGSSIYSIDDFLNVCRALDCKFFIQKKHT